MAQAKPNKGKGKGKGKASAAFVAAVEEYELMGVESDDNAFLQVIQDAQRCSEAAEAAKRSLRPAKVRQPPGSPAPVLACTVWGTPCCTAL